MKALKTILIIVGIGLIAWGLIQAFVPETVFKLGPLEVEEEEGLSNQTMVILGLGVLSLIIGAVVRK
ncbi:MAG TPA: hypothetical protein VK021_08605 [Flavobacteriaceae bacterium]|nr:hypothetical protein [Flavobacteriaceae bacterium]